MSCASMRLPAGASWLPIDQDEDARTPHATGRIYVDIVIRRVADGVERTHVDHTGFVVYDDDRLEALRQARFWWLEGNGRCDCNRRLDFARAGGESTDEIELRNVCTRDQFRIVSPLWLAYASADIEHAMAILGETGLG